MTKIFSFFLFFLLLTLFSFAQTCNDDVIMNTKGSWKKVSDANPFPDQSFPKNQFSQVNIRIDKMQKLLQAAYPEPKGIEAEWYRNITGDAVVKGGPVPYALNALFQFYHCSYEKKIESAEETRGGETGTWFYVWANQLNGWFAEFVKYYTIHKLPVYLLPKKIGVFNSYPLYQGIRKFSSAIILTRAGQSPYLPVTQKQFLKAFINYKEKRFVKSLDQEINRTVKTDAEEEEAKKQGWEYQSKFYKGDVAERRKADYLKNYVTDKQRKEVNIARMKKSYEDELKPARDFLADSLKINLEQSAILDFDNLLTFKEFITEEKGGRELVRLNPDYFNMTLPKYIPQLLIVHWSWNDEKPTNYWREQVEKNFDFKALQEMIDK